MGFWKELRERKVVRVAIIYAITGWVLAQVAGLALPTFEAPDWVLKTLIFILLLGFPLSLILAWALELTPDGVRISEPATGQKRLYTISGLIAAGMAIWFLGYAMAPGEDPAADDSATSIAVLPFLDLSASGDQDYFAQGIAEQLLDLLAKNTQMQVAARTSSFQFKSDPDDIIRIGELLRVNYVVEGSVRRDGDQVRITAQLIDARSGYHEWSETYTRSMTGIFALQDEISRAIADELEARFGLADGRSQDDTREVNPAAYDEYLLGRHLMNQRTRQSLQDAVMHLRKAAELDPDFAAAHAQAAIAITLLSVNGASYGDLPSTQAIALAEPLVERAMELAPNSAETLAAKGRLVGIKGDWPSADEYFFRAAELNPSYMDVLVWKAAGLRHAGDPASGFETLRDAVKRDPFNYLVNINLLNGFLLRDMQREGLELVRRFDSMGHPRTPFLYGIYFHHLGEETRAARHFLVAMKEDPAHLQGLDVLREVMRHYGMRSLAATIDLPGQEVDRFLAADPDERDAIAEEILEGELEPADMIFVEMARGNSRQALDILQAERNKNDGAVPVWIGLSQAGLERRLGNAEEAERILDEFEPQVMKVQEGYLAAGIGMSGALWEALSFHCLRQDRETCLELLGNIISMPFVNAVLLDYLPEFDFLRDDPEFLQLRQQLDERDARLQSEFLPVICNFDYPPASWRPPAEACDGYLAETPASPARGT